MIYTFGAYELDIQLFELRRAGAPQQIEPKVFDILTYVIRHRDRAVSKSDPLNTAFALGWLGYAYLEQGDAPAAIARLEQARQHLHQFGYRRLEGLYMTFLGEAHLLCGHRDTARSLVHQGLEIAHETPYRTGTAWAQRALGRRAQADGDLAAAEQCLNDALSTFTAMQARFEVGRTHLALAELTQQQDKRAKIILHLSEAHHLFTTRGVQVYVERTTQCASRLGLTFTDTPPVQ